MGSIGWLTGARPGGRSRRRAPGDAVTTDEHGGNERVSPKQRRDHGDPGGERVDIDLTDPATPVAVVVPAVVGHHIDVALRRLDGLGLVVRVVTTEVHDKTDRHVVSTDPPAGAVARRPVIEVVVGIAPVVADYVGLDLDDAVRLAEVAGHVVEVVAADARHPEPEPTGLVLAQEPDPGERSRVVLLRCGSDGPGREPDPNP